MNFQSRMVLRQGQVHVTSSIHVITLSATQFEAQQYLDWFHGYEWGDDVPSAVKMVVSAMQAVAEGCTAAGPISGGK